ncbi:hypothetical protein GW590_08395 [Rahnella sp. SAP-1]|jgi:hypothetical protein|uniref:Uncharacterized protein n=1 Tax=Rouxiella aceris TaxID=2703884 RepID=A0A848MIU9_9GAMM|nr:hypothetical protein [Rouxiella aceris]NMP26882.1 hypothetical protein [Rouxiella aceris]
MANFTQEQIEKQITDALVRNGTPRDVARSAALQGARNYAPGQSIAECIDQAKKALKTIKRMPGKPSKPRAGSRR